MAQQSGSKTQKIYHEKAKKKELVPPPPPKKNNLTRASMIRESQGFDKPCRFTTWNKK